MILNFKNHIVYSWRFARFHLAFSAAALLLVYFLIRIGWYPDPWYEMLKVERLFLILAFVELMCGPVLALVLYAPWKSRRELFFDIGSIVVIQIFALAYGVNSIFLAHPVVFAFEVDRFSVVTVAEVRHELLQKAPDGYREIPLFGLLRVGLRSEYSSKEYLDSLELSLQGVSQSMRPNWWRPYDESVIKAVMLRAKPLAQLAKNKPGVSDILRNEADRVGVTMRDLYYLPLISSRYSDWIAILREDGIMVGALNIDGFD